MLLKHSQLANVNDPIEVIPCGIDIEINLWQSQNTPSPKWLIFVGNFIILSSSQFSNAHSLIEETLSVIVKDDIVLLPLKAYSPIVCTDLFVVSLCLYELYDINVFLSLEYKQSSIVTYSSFSPSNVMESHPGNGLYFINLIWIYQYNGI